MNIYVLRLQKLVNLAGYSPALKEDGEYGPKTEQGISWLDNRIRLFGKMPSPEPALRVPATGTFDERTEKNIATLLPKVQILARQFMLEVSKAGINAKIIDGSRTVAQQNALYAQGRSAPGSIITQARGDASWHVWGVAFDIAVFDQNGKYLGESPDYSKAGVIAEALGLEWGGRWGFRDEPHMQLRPESVKGLKDSQAFAVLREKVSRGEAIV